MKVLLIGEASGTHQNLKKGLASLGHDTVHMVINERGRLGRSHAGGFVPNYNNIFSGVSRNISPFYKIRKLENFDVINFSNSISAVSGTYTKYLDLPLLKSKANLLSYYALACDELGIVRKSSVLPYSPCATCLSSGELMGRDCAMHMNPMYSKSVKRIEKYFDVGACSMIEYDHVSTYFDSFKHIPLPVDVDNIEFQPISRKSKLTIVHTPSRRGFKGTAVVEEAIKALMRQRDDFEFEIIHGLPYKEYMSVIKKADIIVDQVYSQSPGMNALEMIAAGKVVLTGATTLGKSYFPFMKEFPGINADPDSDILKNTLSDILDKKDMHINFSEKNCEYIKKNHSPEVVAREFLDLWAAGQ